MAASISTSISAMISASSGSVTGVTATGSPSMCVAPTWGLTPLYTLRASIVRVAVAGGSVEHRSVERPF